MKLLMMMMSDFDDCHNIDDDGNDANGDDDDVRHNHEANDVEADRA